MGERSADIGSDAARRLPGGADVAGMKPSLGVDLGGVQLPTPVLAASGCLGTGREMGALVDVAKLGGVVTRTLTYGPNRGAPTPRVAETASGVVTAVGLQNPGVRAFLEEDLPKLAHAGVPVIPSVGGATLEEFLSVTSALHVRPGIVALEVYVSGPDGERGGQPFYARIERLAEIVGGVSRLSHVPVFAKLPALLPDLVDAAHACVRVGAHGLTLIDGLPAMSVDPQRLRARVASGVGTLSGPAIKPVAIAAVHRVARAMPHIPIMGVGGIATADDAIEFLLAGAWAVQLGTVLLVNPDAPVEVSRGLAAYLLDKGIGSPADLRGRVRVGDGASA
jgi:dihydroorotate dehydrogenase (NAD+) catalytic subunit